MPWEVLWVLLCVLIFRAEPGYSNLQADLNLPPMVMQMLFGGGLEMAVEKLIHNIPNKQCAEQLRTTAQGALAMDYWALNMLDASVMIPQGPAALLLWSFGNHDQCFRVQGVGTPNGRISGQYCLVRVCLREDSNCVDDMSGAINGGIKTIEKSQGHEFNLIQGMEEAKSFMNSLVARIAVCVPSSCTASDLQRFFSDNLSRIGSKIHVNVGPSDCHIMNEASSYELLDYLTLALFTFMLAVITWSTVYDLTHREPGKRNELYIAFSAYSNVKKIFSTSESGEVKLACLHGIRFLSVVYVVVAHVYAMLFTLPIQNLYSAYEFLKSGSSVWLTAGYFSVDTFLVISGLLISYVFLNFVAETKRMDFRVFYLHRIIRLTPALAAVVLFDLSLRKKMNDGPFWTYGHQDDCDTAWWKILLFVKNFYPMSPCLLHSWYLSVDTQLYFLAPLVLVPLWRNPRLGKRILWVALFFSWIIPFMNAYVGSTTVPMRAPIFVTNNLEESIKLYMRTDNRFGPWVIGVWLGYLLHRIRSGKITVRIHKTMVVAMWMFITATLLGCIQSVHPYSQFDHEYHRFGDSFYYSVIRLLWSSAIATLIFACANGYGGPINWLLSHRIWAPWSRLTYCIYLVHLTVQKILFFNIRTGQFFDHSIIMRKTMGILLISAAVALVLSLMFESPITALERLLLKRERQANLQRSSKDFPDDIQTKKGTANGALLPTTKKEHLQH